MFSPVPALCASYPHGSGSSGPFPASHSEEGFNEERPYLRIVEQPAAKCHFRYLREIQGSWGSHGSLLGRSSNQGRTYPTVELVNYAGEEAVKIRCLLYTAKEPLIHHMHQLMAKRNAKEISLDHEITVSERNGFRAEFQGLGIVRTKKQDIKKVLIKKKTQEYKEKQRGNMDQASLTTEDLQRRTQWETEAEEEAKDMDPNKVKLCFQAFYRGPLEEVNDVCKAVFSDVISDSKSASVGQLKICQMSYSTASCGGDTDLFMLVDKVSKDNVKVRFFEEDENSDVVWEKCGEIVTFHHQFALIVRVPAFKNQDINEKVRVNVQLVRGLCGDEVESSEPLPFYYKPNIRPAKRSHGELYSNSGTGSHKIDETRNPVKQSVTTLHNCKNNQICQSQEFPSTNIISSEAYTENLYPVENYELLPSMENSQIIQPGQIQEIQSSMGTLDCFGGDSCAMPSVFQDWVFDYMPTSELKKKNDDLKQYSVAIDGCTVNENSFVRSKGLIRLEVRLKAAVVNGDVKELSDILKSINSLDQHEVLNYRIGEQAQTALMIAAENNYLDCVKQLYSAGADCNIGDFNENTVLHITAKKNNHMCLQELLSIPHNIQVNSKNDRGETALHVAVMHGNWKCAGMLLVAGADLNSRTDTGGKTPLHLAVALGNIDIIKCLLQQDKIDVEEVDYEGKTALERAADSGQKEIISQFKKSDVVDCGQNAAGHEAFTDDDNNVNNESEVDDKDSEVDDDNDDVADGENVK